MATLIFDYDGTLHDAIRIYAPAFRKACAWLEERGLLEPREWSDARVSRWLGQTSVAMWADFHPALGEGDRLMAEGIILDEMKRRIQEGLAWWYPGAVEVLRELKGEGHRLVFLSNCTLAYMEAHQEAFGLEGFFEAFYPGEAWGFRPKHEIFPSIRERFGTEETYLMIGDRHHDMDVGVVHGIFRVGCLYGYGPMEELHGADRLVRDVREIPLAVRGLLNR